MSIMRYQPEGVADRTGFETKRLDRLAKLFGDMIEEGAGLCWQGGRTRPYKRLDSFDKPRQSGRVNC